MKPKKNLNFFWALLLFVLIFPLLAFAHPGGRDASGCHVCRTNCDKYGVLFNAKHCHVKATTTPQSPIFIPSPVQKSKSIPKSNKQIEPAKVISVKTTEAEARNPIKIQTAQAAAPFFSKTSTLWLLSAVGVGILAALGFVASKRIR